MTFAKFEGLKDDQLGDAPMGFKSINITCPFCGKIVFVYDPDLNKKDEFIISSDRFVEISEDQKKLLRRSAEKVKLKLLDEALWNGIRNHKCEEKDVSFHAMV